jgi:3-oxoadipate enol-lactonase
VKPLRIVDPPLAYWRWGDGDTAVVLLHGVGGTGEAWADDGSGTGPMLAQAGYRAIAADLPGYGESATVQPYDMATLADAVAELIDSLRARRNVLVGHSMGGMVAQELFARRPGKVQALVLCNTSPAFGKPGGEWQQQFLRERFAPLDAGLSMAALAAQLVPALVAPQADSLSIAVAQRLMASVPEATYRSALAALVAFDRRAALARIDVPTLVLTGEFDPTAPPSIAQRMAARIAGADCIVVEGAGHLASLEMPTKFNRTLLDFLQRRVPVAGA